MSIIHFKLYNRQFEVCNRQFEVYNRQFKEPKLKNKKNMYVALIRFRNIITVMWTNLRLPIIQCHYFYFQMIQFYTKIVKTTYFLLLGSCI